MPLRVPGRQTSTYDLAIELARRQGGLVHSKQLRGRGCTRKAIHLGRKRGWLQPRLRALRVEGGVPLWAESRSDTFRAALADAHALALSLGEGAIVSGPAAAVLLGCEGRGKDADWVRRLANGILIAYIPSERRVRIPGVTVIRGTFTGARESVDGVLLADRTTALLDTLHALYGWRPVQATEFLDACLQLRWLTPEMLQDRLIRRRAQNGPRGRSRRLTGTLQAAVRHADLGSHSHAERRCAKVLLGHGLRRGGKRGWLANHEVGGVAADGSAHGLAWTCRPDFVWPSQRVVLEVDGKAFHSSAESFDRDRERDRRLSADGWTVLRATWDAITQRPGELIGELKRCLARGPARAPGP